MTGGTVAGGATASLLELFASAVLVFAVVTLWRRELRAIVVTLAAQGAALAAVAGVLAVSGHNLALGATALLVLCVKAGVVPALLGRLVASDPSSRETKPVVNVPASLVAASVLIVLAFVVSAHLVALSPSPATRLAPLGIATVLVGYLALATRRRAVSQIVGLLVLDNGIALVTFLLVAGVPLIVELGAALDVLLVVVVLGALALQLRDRFGAADLDQLTELRD